MNFPDSVNKVMFYVLARNIGKLSHSNALRMTQNLSNSNASEFKRYIINNRDSSKRNYYFRTRALGENHRTAMNVVKGNSRDVANRERAGRIKRLLKR